MGKSLGARRKFFLGVYAICKCPHYDHIDDGMKAGVHGQDASGMQSCGEDVGNRMTGTSGSAEAAFDARRDRASKAFVRAQQHSRTVGFLKYFLPVAAFVVLASAIGYIWFVQSMSGVDASVNVAGTAIKDGNLVMANPKISGVTADDKDYFVEALRAFQPINGEEGVRLEEISGRFELQEGLTGTLRSETGLLEDDNTRLTLGGASVFETSDGMVVRFDGADIDMQAGTLETTRPVRIEQPGAIIEAEAMKIEDGGKRIVFERNVVVVIDANRIRIKN